MRFVKNEVFPLFPPEHPAWKKKVSLVWANSHLDLELGKALTVKTPPAKTLYAMNPTFSFTGDDASDKPFSSTRRLIREKSFYDGKEKCQSFGPCS